jgi:uncharacterized RDD family membrane protein YckC
MALVATPALSSPIPSETTPRAAYRAAGFFRRLAAAAVDFLVLSPVLALLGVLLCLALGQPVPHLGELSPDLIVVALLDGNTAGEALLLLGAIVSALYVVLFLSTRGQTPGKQLLGLLVINAYGERPSLPKTLLRTVGYALSVLPFSLGFLWIGFDREKRALHDWLAGTYVVLAP